ncbi:uncharacterized protein [Apostichopus japonicus]|uniref:uncharacterized protein isoform X2 n=1 Tax=Stichopus japonicus TaxID=307972 RepID=UPI003AB3E02D
MEKYAIVEFQNSLAGVVPTSWIFKKDGKIWCKWTASRTKTIACELPNPSWTTSSIKRVVAYRASYSEADNVCLGFEHSSTVEVTEADLNFPEADPATSSSTSNSKRNIFRPLHYTGEPNSNTDETGKNSKNQRQKRGKKRSLHTLDEAELDEASTAEEPSSESDETGENSKKGTKKRFLHDAELDEASHTTEEPSSESDGPAKQQSELPPPPET